MDKFYTYIVFSESRNKYYIGSTQNIKARLTKHNAGATKSTKNGRPWILVYSEEFTSRSLAIKRELEIKKKKSRIYIEYLIQSDKSVD